MTDYVNYGLGQNRSNVLDTSTAVASAESCSFDDIDQPGPEEKSAPMVCGLEIKSSMLGCTSHFLTGKKTMICCAYCIYIYIYTYT